ncbi:hypothetical protein GCM10009641_27320 [Mycobacterium cookii]|uniref:Helicase/UvrB N-terminal domain-containing protein n=1 Tax=Nocardioides furvisabuli TaxID=375542 RepID=A0ABP5I6G4_9ACTN|nr:DEAD/DEAH box helicase family protein [Nocardioides furvisabuli]
MRFILKDYQFAASAQITSALKRATKGVLEDPEEVWAITLSAPTGAGKTVIATSVIETVFDGNDQFGPDDRATILWVTDDPALNEQTKRNMNLASSTLGPNRFETIDSGFDQPTFDPGHIYFLNIQKLARSNPLARSNTDGRTNSIWQTIANTIEINGPNFYVVIDEAHRGMKQESDRQTIISRIINGQPGINPPVPIVWGISATPERFEKAMAGRFPKSFDVPIEDVRASGLLKDKIVLDNPTGNQIGGDTTFIRAGVAQTVAFERAWESYATTQNEPPVLPVMVLQVGNTPSDAEMTEYLDAVFDSWDGLTDKNVVNTFGEHVAISAGSHTIGYRAPQDIQDDTDIRVVLCKDAISTGWDCPRAEVMVSLRTLNDYTAIAQLIGRMVRTPLARRITTDQTLNDVHCYLPSFNKDQVAAIVARFAEGKNDEPPVEIISNPVTLEHNTKLPDEVFDLLGDLPTYVVPGRVYRTQIARLHTLATLLAGDHIVEDALTQARIHPLGVLKTRRQAMEADGSFKAALDKIRALRIERSYLLLAADSMDDLPAEVQYDLDRDDNNIEDLFRVAKRKLPEGLALNYWNSIFDAHDDDYDPTEAKAETAVLALNKDVVEAVESAAEKLVQQWLKKYQPSIAKLSDVKKALYEPVKRETRTPELTELILPSSKTTADVQQMWELHVLANDEGKYPSPHKGWELRVLEREFKDDDLVAWYRNPTGTSAALRIPWRLGQLDKSMYPDFIMFHQTDEGIRPSIIDPHGQFLRDAPGKLRGLSDYAEAHGGTFARIDAVVEIDKTLVALNMKSEVVREAVRKVTDDTLDELYEKHGGDYS